MEPEKESRIKSFKIQEESLWKQQLQQTGVVVLKQILTNDEVQKTISLFWDWLEALDLGIKRNQPLTWDQWPGMKQLGFFATYGGSHTQASWFIRCHNRVRQAFQKIWETKDLITSFDTMIGWKPWWVDKHWQPFVQNLHVDQNPYFKKGFKCVQGMVPLKRVRKQQIGGLMVVPNSNNDETQKQLIQRYPSIKNYKSDWLQLKSTDPYVQKQKGVLVECDAGDLILWDSRTIHGGKICQPSQQFKQNNLTDFVRLSQTVTMLPRTCASKQTLAQRKRAFRQKIGLNHWANQYHKSGMGNFLPNLTTSQIKYEWVKLTPEVESLI